MAQQPPLGAYTERHGTTDDPRDTLNNSTLHPGQIEQELVHYESQFPEETYAETSLALIGEESITDIITKGEEFLAGETEVEIPDEQQPSLERYLTLLEALEPRLESTFRMRQYDTSNGDTPQEINDKAAENKSAFSLMSHSAAINAVAQVAVYSGMKSAEYAIIVNVENRTSPGPFTVKVGKYHGGFDVYFADDVDTFIETEFHPDSWRRPKDLTN